MAGAAPAKKQEKRPEDKWGIWLTDLGLLSFGRGSGYDVLVEKVEYDDLKNLPNSARGQALKSLREKKDSPPEESVKTPEPEAEKNPV